MTNNDLNAIFFVNATTGFVVGANGTILKTTDGGVPVELLSFTASLVGDDRVDLFWSTASETNNYGFEIERRTITNNPQGSWERIGFVTGRGTTTNPQAYSFTDGIGLQSAIRNLKSVQYRLKQIDNDGRYEYSQIVALHFPMLNAISLDQNYPNPVITSSFYSNALSTVRFTLNTSAHVSLIIMDQHGRQLKTLLDENRSSGPHYITFDASKFPSGIYFYRLRASGKEIITKMVVH